MAFVDIRGDVQPNQLAGLAQSMDEENPQGTQIQRDIQSYNAANPIDASPGLVASDASAPAPTPNAAPQPTGPAVHPFETEMTDFFKDPKRLGDMAMLAATTQRGDIMQWLKQGHVAAQENYLEALGNLRSGDTQGAINAFNRSGRFKASAIQQTDQPGIYHITTDAGEFDLDPNKAYWSILTPPEAAGMMNRQMYYDAMMGRTQAQIAGRQQAVETQVAGRQNVADTQAQTRIAEGAANRGQKEPLVEAQTRAANARADTTEQGAQGTKPFTAKDWNDTATQARSQIKDLARDQDQYGRTTYDEGMMSFMNKFVDSKMRADAAANGGRPTRGVGDFVRDADEMWKNIRGNAAARVDQEVSTLKQNADSGHWFVPNSKPDWSANGANAKNEADYRAQRMKQLTSPGAAPPSVPSGNTGGWSIEPATM